MSSIVEIRVPDLDDLESVEVIEILVQPGDVVKAEDSLLTIESEKAAMEIPAAAAGAVKSVAVKLHDVVKERDLLVEIEVGGELAADDSASPSEEEPPVSRQTSGEEQGTKAAQDSSQVSEEEPPVSSQTSGEEQGMKAAPDSSQIPEEKQPVSPHTPGEEQGMKAAPDSSQPPEEEPPVSRQTSGEEAGAGAKSTSRPTPAKPGRKPLASPSVRRFARELGVPLDQIISNRPKGRILKQDVEQFVKYALARPADSRSGIPSLPATDFSRFGPVENVEMKRIAKLTARQMKLAWLQVPLVTQHDEADVTELEDLRQSLKPQAEMQKIKLTLLPFVLKALTMLLADFPKFNASLDEENERLVYKHYFHIGIAVDTPEGLVAPVLRDADRKDLFEIASGLHDLVNRARNRKLRREDLEGGCITISNQGGIGGSAFTPIVNPPEVAILGMSRTRTAPVWDGSRFIPRLMMPLDLSYDHRVNNGADAARFLSACCRLLGDPESILK